jgi:glyoxylate/hydroxypyruvate reductase A
MALLFFKDPEHPDGIDAEIKRRLPDLAVRLHPDLRDPSEFSYLLGYDPPVELIQALPNLKIIFSTGAGADGLLRIPNLPAVPVVRMVHASLSELVGQFAVSHVLAWHRDLWTYRRQQAAAEWRPLPLRRAHERRVGVLGLGAIGKEVVRILLSLGFDVAGWSRTPRNLDGVRTFAGSAGLPAILRQSDIVVSVLPLTADTLGILNLETLGMLPSGAVLINVGRGAHLVESDLVKLLDADHLSGASLDVFREEPLPPDHPFWRHPKVIVTPHVAGAVSAPAMADVVATQIQRFKAGLPLQHAVDRAEGY